LKRLLSSPFSGPEISAYIFYCYLNLASLIRGTAGAAGLSFEGYPFYCGGDEGGGGTSYCYTHRNKAWIQVRKIFDDKFFEKFFIVLISIFLCTYCAT
jgi:hypothetical protein